MFERVYTHPAWYDGHREGIADYRGRPHLFVSQWEDRGIAPDIYLLSPVDPETFLLALEVWEIWLRYETAHRGLTTLGTHPALPEDRARYEELEPLLAERLVLHKTHRIRKGARFRVHEGNLEVEWRTPIAKRLQKKLQKK